MLRKNGYYKKKTIDIKTIKESLRMQMYIRQTILKTHNKGVPKIDKYLHEWYKYKGKQRMDKKDKEVQKAYKVFKKKHSETILKTHLDKHI